MSVYSLAGKSPVLPLSGDYWIAPGAHVIGDVTLSEGVGIWFGAVLRGDNEPILIGAGTNIQENCVLHTDPGAVLRVGRDVTVGHKAMLHGCTIGDNSLIGMGATVLNHAKIGANCLIGAGALVTEGREIPDGSLVVGAPGKVVRALDAAAIAMLTQSARGYSDRMRRFREDLVVLSPRP